MTDHIVKMKVGRFTLEGLSIAGEQTAIRVAELNLCFDLGKAPMVAVRSPIVLLSHGHQDHLAGLSYYFSNRNFRGMSVGKIVLPAAIRNDVAAIMRLWRKVEGYAIPYKLKGVRAGQRFKVRPRTEALAFATDHTGPSLGYCLMEVRQKLRPKYEGLAPQEIQQLARGGASVSRLVRVPTITYLGDTQVAGLELPAPAASSEVLIAECTFLSPDHVHRAKAGRHVHIRDLAAFLEQFTGRHIVLHHFSSRYPLANIPSVVRRCLPASVLRRVRLFLPGERSR